MNAHNTNQYFDNLHFITFAEGKQFSKFAEWNKKKLLKAYPTAKVSVYNSTHLSEEIIKFAKSNSRGFGYWIWKPWIINQYIKQLTDNEVIIYFDSRAAFMGSSILWLNSLINPKNEPKIDFVVYRSENHLEIEWTKKDAIHFFGFESNTEILFTGQIFATMIGFSLNNQTRILLNKWLNLSIENNILINDDILLPNFPEYIEHRHDQSILSLLLKKEYKSNSSKILFLSKEEISRENSIILHYFTHPKKSFPH